MRKSEGKKQVRSSVERVVEGQGEEKGRGRLLEGKF